MVGNLVQSIASQRGWPDAQTVVETADAAKGSATRPKPVLGGSHSSNPSPPRRPPRLRSAALRSRAARAPLRLPAARHIAQGIVASDMRKPNAGECARQGNLRTDLVFGSGWDQLVLPLATCVSYAKDLAPLAYNDQAGCRCEQCAVCLVNGYAVP